MTGIPAGRVLRGKETNSLDQFSVFDKVINIKFIRKKGSPETDFCLRSDYEVYVDQFQKPHFRRIQQKPQIKVTYKQVANEVAIKVDVEITNLYIKDDMSGDSIFAANGNPVETMVIQMGYINQFPDWTKEPRATGRGSLQKFYDMNNFAFGNAEDFLNTGLEIKVMVLTAHRKSAPPDQVTYFQGIVGTMRYGLQWNQQMTGYANRNYPSKNLTQIEKIFFLLIQSRFLNSAAVTRMYDSRKDPKNEGKTLLPDQIEQWVEVRDYWSWLPKTDPGYLPKDRIEEMVADGTMTAEQRWYRLELDKAGYMNVKDAQMFGVVCTVSDKLKAWSRNNVAARGDGSDIALQDGTKLPMIEQQTYIGGQILKIAQAYPFIRWYQQFNGNFYIYHVDEEAEVLSKASDNKMKPLRLPAVYDITVSGTRVIRCPFVSFIAPLQKVGFSTRYAINDLVGFYYRPERRDAWYMVLLADIEFSTTGEENEMRLTCVDTSAPPEGEGTQAAAPAAGSTGEANTAVEQERIENWRKEWHEKPITIVEWEGHGDIDYGDDKSGSLSQMFVHFMSKTIPDAEDNDWKAAHAGNSVKAIAAGVQQILDWNPQYKSRKNGPETDAYGIPIPVVELGDKFVIRLPYMKEYA